MMPDYRRYDVLLHQIDGAKSGCRVCHSAVSSREFLVQNETDAEVRVGTDGWSLSDDGQGRSTLAIEAA
jgi:hypothetical protein